MNRTVKYTAFATNKETGERGYGNGEITVSHWIGRHQVPDAISSDLDRQGYTDVTVDNYSDPEG
ncbi:hypothetical protein [Streptomyces mexicanus]|uniref:hypothetical protein n=1 Tax=Streptomyces mexicanus TaxID=178566 RepID=UPI00365E9E2C